MAGGIDWFRWHHGSVTDQKFPLIAKRAGSSVAEVIAVWACLLEAASMNESERGILSGTPDFEAMDCALGMADGKAEAIFRAMRDRDLVDGCLQITAWPKRQPKREREGDNSTGRVKAFRERQRQETPGNASSEQGSTTERQETPREEESREEKEPSSSSPPGDDGGTVHGIPMPCPQDRIRRLYAEALPMLPQPKLWTADRQKALRGRWGEMAREKGWRCADDGVDWFRRFFEAVAEDDFLMGRTKRSAEHANWECSIDYLLSPKGFRRVYETAGRQRETA